ncbi:cuticle protein 12.5-like [Contarinia nasturtii]|uniref:cuticle protein 12.5-like n=1 Tax=Contarinia nasturtii TaxID=265458 RepID=UPI0012D3F3CB|nr:cuticle protein 12.5-like [Contarinia nasturtii]
MFKLIVLSALFALAAAKPSGYLAAPTLIAAPAVTKIVQPPPVVVHSSAQVGSVVSSIPTGVSSHSSSVVHSTGAVVTPVITPVQKTIISAPVVAAPVYKTYAAPAVYQSPVAYHAAPALSYAHAPLSYSAPLAYSAYSAPALW